jgi:hypothetical protein
MPDLPAFHGWTHRPKALGGTDPVEIAVDPITITSFFTGTYSVGPVPAMTIPHNTLTVLEWEVNTNSATEPGQGSFYASDAFATAGSEQTTHNAAAHTAAMWIYRSGLYLVGCAVQWETGNYQKQSQLQQEIDPPTGASDDSFFGVIHDQAPTLVTAPIASMLLPQNPVVTAASTTHQHIDVWEIPPPGAGDATDRKFQVEVLQTSGSDKQVLAARLSVIRLSDVTY